MDDDLAARLRELREEARQRLDELDHDLDGVVQASRDTNADDEHDPEGATIAYERSQLGALRAQARARLAEVDAALERLAAGRYGRCEVCGEPIPPARLVARPTARTCVAHA
ncbi:TraR/DksA family transcriptional regulator [Nocardioides aequoreus]|uniref:TraR/DksA family transcriptional regulator n=1 Tax=Nocardioides aequoreus TaxID=397278 RepID=UPI00068B3137|nr:TraR/DksA C4-type zinc finger protein [Nocardioides aequoreus]